MFDGLAHRGRELSGAAAGEAAQAAFLQQSAQERQAAATALLQERTTSSVSQLAPMRDSLEVPLLAAELAMAITQFPGQENEKASCSSFAWAPRPTAMLGWEAAVQGSATMPVEVQGIAGCNIHFDQLGGVAVLLYQRGAQHVELPRIAVVPHALELPSEASPILRLPELLREDMPTRRRQLVSEILAEHHGMLPSPSEVSAHYSALHSHGSMSDYDIERYTAIEEGVMQAARAASAASHGVRATTIVGEQAAKRYYLAQILHYDRDRGDSMQEELLYQLLEAGKPSWDALAQRLKCKRYPFSQQDAQANKRTNPDAHRGDQTIDSVNLLRDPTLETHTRNLLILQHTLAEQLRLNSYSQSAPLFSKAAPSEPFTFFRSSSYLSPLNESLRLAPTALANLETAVATPERWQWLRKRFGKTDLGGAIGRGAILLNTSSTHIVEAGRQAVAERLANHYQQLLDPQPR